MHNKSELSLNSNVSFLSETPKLTRDILLSLIAHSFFSLSILIFIASNCFLPGSKAYICLNPPSLEYIILSTVSPVYAPTLKNISFILPNLNFGISKY